MPSGDWWIVIAGQVVFTVIWVINAALEGPIDGRLSPVLQASTFLYLLLTVASAPALYRDRTFLKRVSDWTPTSAYYVMAVPVVLFVHWPVALFYLYRRHRVTGTP